MKNVIGTPARKGDFFKRVGEIQKLGRRIEAGGHIQLTAPRRVGKTSILMYFIDNPLNGYHFVYVDTEGIEDQNQYFKKIYQEILKSTALSNSERLIKQMSDGKNKLLGKIKSIKILKAEVELTESDEINYEEELSNLIKGINLEGEKIVLLNDEFPYTVENIIEKNKGEVAEANNFLKANRAFRQNHEINCKLQIVYTGSIGLNALVERLGKTELINDLDVVGVNAMNNEKEAIPFTREILQNYGYTIDDDAVAYLLKKIEWVIPFHIQLALKEIMDLVTPDEVITEIIIDKAFNEIIDYRNNSYFDHYFTRLKKHFAKNEFKFAKDLLCLIATKDTLHSNEMFNLAVKYKLESSFKSIIGTLVYDGYINNNEQHDTYRFNSPIIKIWWKKYVCN